MNLFKYIQQAEREAFKQHIKANSVMLNSTLELVSEGYAVIGDEVRHYSPMICGLSAFLTDELPDDIAFAVFESPNLPLTREEEVRKEAREEFLAELREMTFEEIASLLSEVE
jgi:hypothetical protein